MTLRDFDYQLPPEKIAQTPVHPRDTSKLLIVDRKRASFTDKHFADLADLLTPDDVLVLNNTKVFPARLLVHKVLSLRGAKNERRGNPMGSSRFAQDDSSMKKPIELLLEKEVRVTGESISWDALTKPGLKVGDTFEIPGSHVRGVCEEVRGYTRRVTFFIDREHFLSQLDRWAKTPIPPYIRWNSDDELHLREVYQTVYAKYQGAVAAPTAGLHFTPELLSKLRKKGVQIEEVTLHVGLGTFLPVKTERIEEHHMHGEWFELSQPVAENLNDAKRAGKRIIAVGTTTVRVLETCASLQATTHYLQARSGSTQIFIYPPYQFKFVDSMITNFHTPKSTLLMLISAFASAPNHSFPSPLLGERQGEVNRTKFPAFSTFLTSLVGKAYTHALENNYRFYSFGDAMWITE